MMYHVTLAPRSDGAPGNEWFAFDHDSETVADVAEALRVDGGISGVRISSSSLGGGAYRVHAAIPTYLGRAAIVSVQPLRNRLVNDAGETIYDPRAYGIAPFFD